MPELEQYTAMINETLLREIPENGGIVCDAMRYSLQNGGKRIRPVLTLEFCRLCGGDIEAALPFAHAVEMIHTYSLIHDDLPCMDNDDERRGKPSCHIAFGYEFALLAGDALLTLAFEKLASATLPAKRIVEAVRLLSKAAGFAGMVGGQELDLKNVGNVNSVETLRHTDALKTGALIKVACMLGCTAAGASEIQREAASVYADNIGLAFQIMDDILDVTGDTETLGKPAGSDEKNDKVTYVSILGLEASKKMVDDLTQNALEALSVFGGDGDFLRTLAVRLSARTH